MYSNKTQSYRVFEILSIILFITTYLLNKPDVASKFIF